MNKAMATLAAALFVGAAAAPAWADGAGPDDCTGQVAGATCYSYDLQMSGVCVADAMGLLTCETGVGGAGTGGTGTMTSTGGGGQGGEGGGGGAGSEASSGCSVRQARANGGPEAVGLGMLLALCFAVQRRRRDLR